MPQDLQRVHAPNGDYGWEVRPDLATELDLGAHQQLLVARIRRCCMEQPNFSVDLLRRVDIVLQHDLDPNPYPRSSK